MRAHDDCPGRVPGVEKKEFNFPVTLTSGPTHTCSWMTDTRQPGLTLRSLDKSDAARDPRKPAMLSKYSKTTGLYEVRRGYWDEDGPVGSTFDDRRLQEVSYPLRRPVQISGQSCDGVVQGRSVQSRDQ